MMNKDRKDRIDAIKIRLRRLCCNCIKAPANRNAERLLPYCDACKLKHEAADELNRLTREREALANTLQYHQNRRLAHEEDVRGTQWRTAGSLDIGRLGRFCDRIGDDWRYGKLSRISDGEFRMVSEDGGDDEPFYICEVEA